ncbi:MAG: ABC transporter ATP-binding protein [Deltaproteobacteria bacterium]|nr:ABC transporter ATP-binding protein [Deltaproteobacteria bacterium]MBW2130706.1 ABC transporter ATP-binding protein [Deltaproteobacteria bacterium]MBW2304843.1 ABC transporter ATP-binding protein [Deltaproteobacteria bacterium]
MARDRKNTLLAVEDLSVHFHTDRGVVRALEQVQLTVGKGEVVGLIGESGSGKTTTVRSVLRILPPSARITEGSVHFLGKDLLAMPEKELNETVRGRGITLVPQDPFNSLNPVFTVGTQIRDILKWKGGKGLSEGTGLERIKEILQEVQIPSPVKQLRKYPHQFSGGQRQRLMIAMALLPRPSLVIADEPTTALDVTVEAQILRLFRGLVEERGISVLFITHDLGVASQICKRIVVMYAGQDMEDAPAERIFESPGHPYTRELLESLPNPEGNIRDIPGEVPSLLNPPEGCRFHPRCPLAEVRCTRERPPKVEIDSEHWVRCFRPLE